MDVVATCRATGSRSGSCPSRRASSLCLGRRLRLGAALRRAPRLAPRRGLPDAPPRSHCDGVGGVRRDPPVRTLDRRQARTPASVGRPDASAGAAVAAARTCAAFAVTGVVVGGRAAPPPAIRKREDEDRRRPKGAGVAGRWVMAGASPAGNAPTATRWSRRRIGTSGTGPGHGPALRTGRWSDASVALATVRERAERRRGVSRRCRRPPWMALPDGGVELRRPRALAGEDVRRDLEELERRRVVRPCRGAGIDVGEPPLPRLAVAEDVDPQLDGRRLVEALRLEPDRRRAERRVVAAGVARRPVERRRPRTGRAAPEISGNGSGSGNGRRFEEAGAAGERGARARASAGGRARSRRASSRPPPPRALRARAPRTARASAGRRASPSRPRPRAARRAGSASPAPRASCRTASAGRPRPR